MLPKEAELVVVGGGPTGLVLTSTLRQAGYEVVALDREAAGANDSRAAAIHAKTLEVLRELEATDRNALSNAPQHRAQLSGLAAAIGWERSRLSHHLQRMVRRGFVDRLPSDTDGRATDAALTDVGRKAFRSAVPKHVAWVKRLSFTDLNRGQERTLANILTTVYETILHNGTLPPPDFDEQRPLAAP